MQEIITIYDYVLLPVYLLIFYLIIRRKAKKYKPLGLRKYFIAAFWIRMAGAVFYGLLIQYYYGYGDSFGFYDGGNVLSKMIQHDITAIKYLFYPAKDVVAAAKAMGFSEDIPVSMPNDSNAFIMKLSYVFSLFTFNKYLLISVCFGFLSFIGIWKLFYFFYQLNNKKHIKLLAFFVLFLPSLWFWGSGLLKEPICVCALGIVVYLFYKNFIQKRFSLANMFSMAVLLFIITIVKSYITVLLLISFLFVFICKSISKIKNIFIRVTTIIALLFSITVALITIDISQYTEYFMENSFSQIQQLQSSYQSLQEGDDVGNKGAFLISDLDPSIDNILINSPAVIGTCLFRPFPWESKKIIIFFASLEALLTLLITLYILIKTKFFKFFKYAFSPGILLFSFLFSILFALVVGYTTFNFGTLIRYRIIFLPFYYFMMINIYTKIKASPKLDVK